MCETFSFRLSPVSNWSVPWCQFFLNHHIRPLLIVERPLKWTLFIFLSKLDENGIFWPFMTCFRLCRSTLFLKNIEEHIGFKQVRVQIRQFSIHNLLDHYKQPAAVIFFVLFLLTGFLLSWTGLNIFQQTQLSNLKMALGSMSTNILVVWGSSKIHSTLNFLCLPLMQEKCQQWTRQLVVKRRQLKQEKRQPEGQTIFSRKATGSDSWVFFPIFSIGNFILWFDLIMWKESGRFFFEFYIREE